MIRAWSIIALVVALASCASSRTSTVRDADVITAEEMQTLHVTTAYEIIERLRPIFLRGRGRTSIESPEAQYPVVYIDGVRAGGLVTLRNIAAQDVREIRYISAADATTRYGTGHTGGVIEVRTRG